jgi:hypothetical protein
MLSKKPVPGSIVEVCARNTMYPSFGFMLQAHRASFGVAEKICYSTLFGYAFDTTSIVVDGIPFILRPKEYIGLPVREKIEIQSDGKFFGAFRLGFLGQQTQGRVEEKGRLSYIDGCSDTLLVYPPRQGDPSLNFLYFPPNINQSFHTHPSVRIGCVSEGHGYSCLATAGRETEMPLIEGELFMLEEQELHRFKTTDKSMKVIPYHPDGDWGPTDHNHSMINRTYLLERRHGTIGAH